MCVLDVCMCVHDHVYGKHLSVCVVCTREEEDFAPTVLMSPHADQFSSLRVVLGAELIRFV